MKPESNMMQQDRKEPPEVITSGGTGYNPLDPALDELQTKLQDAVYMHRSKIATDAMQGLLSHYGGASPREIAKMAVENADALIARLNQEKE